MAVIEAEGLVKTYHPRGAPTVHALAGLDLEVPEGTVLGVLGPNGAGKTTAVKVLTTLIRPDAGRAAVDGVDVLTRGAEVRAMIGVSGQYAAVDENLTAFENLDMVGRLYHLGRRASRARADELIGAFGLTEARDRAVKGFSGGIGGASTSRAPSSPAPACSSSTSPRPGWIPAAAWASGTSSRSSSPRARPCSSPPSTSRRPTGSRTTSR